MGEKAFFCTLLREIRVLNLLPKIQISISDAYFSAVEFEVDFFNRIGRKQSVIQVYIEHRRLPAAILKGHRSGLAGTRTLELG